MGLDPRDREEGQALGRTTDIWFMYWHYDILIINRHLRS